MKNLTFGVFLMKLTYEDKIEIYQLRKQGESLKNLSKKYDIADSNIKYLVRLIDQYGIEIAVLKKLRELRLKEEKEKEERLKLFKN